MPAAKPPAKRRSRRRAARRGPRPRFYAFVLGGLLLVGTGLYQVLARVLPAAAPSATPTPVVESRAALVDHSAELFASAARVQQGVETFARQHGGRVPADPAAFDREIVQGGYLGEGLLPASPWGGRQVEMLGVTPEVRQNAGLGLAQVADRITAPHHLGALCYEALGTRRYRIYGIGLGKQGMAAVVVKLGTLIP